jgi:hypothetical protein
MFFYTFFVSKKKKYLLQLYLTPQSCISDLKNIIFFLIHQCYFKKIILAYTQMLKILNII